MSILIQFSQDICKVYYTILTTKMSGISIMDGDVWVEASKEDGATEDRVVYVAEIKKTDLVDKLTLKTTVVKMGMVVEYDIILDIEGAKEL